MKEIYPVVIILDRYGGTYSGALWIAFNEYEIPEGAQDGDVECHEFWLRYSKPVGKGPTPEDAFADLNSKVL